MYKSTSLYIHYPWCVHKCPYCDFNSHQSKKYLEEDISSKNILHTKYTDKLVEDLESDLKLFPFLKQRKLSSVFLGGGTPNVVDSKLLSSNLKKLINIFPLQSSDLEVTIEINPDLDMENSFKDYKKAGINRISIGGQTFNKVGLEFLQRTYTKETLVQTIELALQYFEFVNVDLMFGFGNQTLEEAMEDLNKLFDLGVKHISWYQFSLEPNSVFYSHSKNVLASDNLVSNIIESGLKVLKSNGMTRYEVSAYVDENFHNHKAKHNLNYWNFGDYIGVGAGAHGKITDKNNRITRTNKTRHPDNYLLKREISHIRNTDIIGSKEIVFEYMLNNLRVNGKIVKKDFTIKTGHSWNALLQTLDKYLKKNIIVLNQDCLVVGDKTWGMMDDILQEFL